ncbi:hypothetical protein [Salinicoccus sp. YB14-2]|uniref:hypothetical protein n=1 Tax=Salinicoccus sp. YB14-2 TaxID=1572701 RepID=UPI000B2DA3FA|nr:hypothetical protein [Salinicoccus sp. YB14-2]
MKAVLLMVAIFLLLVLSFVIIWFTTADRVGDSEASLPDSGIEYVGTDREAMYGHMFI